MSKHTLVEDERIRETISFNLDSEGYEVVSVFNGKDALTIRKEKPFDFA